MNTPVHPLPCVEYITFQGQHAAHRIYQPVATPMEVPILMLHGWGVDGSLMDAPAHAMAILGFRVYVPDMPGFGETSAPNHAQSVNDYANWVLGYLDANALTTVHMIGHSFGGRLGIILGAEHPERIVKLILVNSAGVPPRRLFTTQLRLRTYKAIRNGLEMMGAKELSATLRARYNQRYGSSDFQQLRGNMRETFVRVVNEDLRPYAHRIARPTLLVWGEMDEDTPLWQAKELERLIPDAGLVTFPNSGHYSYLENLPQFTRIADHFFRN